MNTAKREAHSLPRNDQKRRCEGVPSVKKVNFRRSNDCVLTADHAKDNKIPKTSGLKVRRSRRSKRRSSHSSCSESEVGGNGKNSELSKNEDRSVNCQNPLAVVDVSGQKNCCSTPIRKGNDMQDCVAQVSASVRKHEQTFERDASSPFGTGIKSIVNNSSFYDDDGVLASLNLSEIITSSGASNPVQRDSNCTSSMKKESNQFYGLPVEVKELLQKFKGIGSLYGKILFIPDVRSLVADFILARDAISPPQ